MDDACGGVGGRVHGRDGTHDHRAGAALHPRCDVGHYPGGAVVGGERILDRGGGAAAPVGLAGRPLRPPAGLPLRADAVHAGLGGRGRLDEHRDADSRPGPAGHRRLHAVPRGNGTAARRLSPEPPPDRHRNLGRDGSAGRSRGACPGSGTHRGLRLASRVLCQRAGRPDRSGGRGPSASGKPGLSRSCSLRSRAARARQGPRDQGGHDRRASGLGRRRRGHPRNRPG